LFVAVKANQFFINNISEKRVFPQLFFLPCGFKEPLVDSKVLSLKGERCVLLLTIPLRQLVSELSQQAWVRWLIYQTMATSPATMIVKEWLFREPNEKISSVKTNKHCVICRQQSNGQRAHRERVSNRPIHRRISKYNKIPFFDGITRKFDFINWILDWEKYFNYWEIYDEEKVRLVSNKLESVAAKWWDDIQDDRVHQGKQEICSWQRMKKRLIHFFFPHYQIQVQVSREVKQVYAEENVFLEIMQKSKKNISRFL
jgi:hypothetical protein